MILVGFQLWRHLQAFTFSLVGCFFLGHSTVKKRWLSLIDFKTLSTRGSRLANSSKEKPAAVPSGRTSTARAEVTFVSSEILYLMRRPTRGSARQSAFDNPKRWAITSTMLRPFVPSRFIGFGIVYSSRVGWYKLFHRVSPSMTAASSYGSVESGLSTCISSIASGSIGA